MNKEILFEDIKCGNLSAFEALFRQYYPSMCVIAGKLVANREVAEDIVQDVFIRLWEKGGIWQNTGFQDFSLRCSA